MKGASSSQVEDLVSSYEVLTSPEKMGERFKFLTITSDPQHTPIPFNESMSWDTDQHWFMYTCHYKYSLTSCLKIESDPLMSVKLKLKRDSEIILYEDCIVCMLISRASPLCQSTAVVLASVERWESLGILVSLGSHFVSRRNSVCVCEGVYRRYISANQECRSEISCVYPNTFIFHLYTPFERLLP